MITADRLNSLINLTPSAIQALVPKSAIKYESSEFLGLTNAGQFCYQMGYLDDTATKYTKVFITATTTGMAASQG